MTFESFENGSDVNSLLGAATHAAADRAPLEKELFEVATYENTTEVLSGRDEPQPPIAGEGLVPEFGEPA